METFLSGARTIAPGCAPRGAVGPGRGPSHWGLVDAPQAPSVRSVGKLPQTGPKAWEKDGKMMKNDFYSNFF
jgi:hypothetical protein